MSEQEFELWFSNLITKYPRVFKNLSYLECSEGWKNIIAVLCGTIERHIENAVPEEVKDEIYAVQIKEKFGGLRFYMSHSTPYIDGAIMAIEQLSYFVCEDCGAPSEKNSSPKRMIKTLCRKCNDKYRSMG